MYEITCVGHICCDILVRPLEALPEKGKLSLVDYIAMQPGGCGQNVAIDLSRMGLRTCLCAKIGMDGFGSFLSDHLQFHGVDTRYLCRSQSDQTSSSVVAISRDGERSILHSKGANGTFSVQDIDLSVLEKTRILFVGGTNLMDSLDGEDTRALLHAARARGIVTALDTAWDATGRWMDKIGCCIRELDWFMPSYEEAVQLSGGKTEPEAMAECFIRQWGARQVVVKLGEKGCYVRAKDESFYAPGARGLSVVDTSGAGDSFCAGFLAGLSRGYAVRDCARLANAAGGLCVTELGTTTWARPMAEVEEFMKERVE